MCLRALLVGSVVRARSALGPLNRRVGVQPAGVYVGELSRAAAGGSGTRRRLPRTPRLKRISEIFNAINVFKFGSPSVAGEEEEVSESMGRSAASQNHAEDKTTPG